MTNTEYQIISFFRSGEGLASVARIAAFTGASYVIVSIARRILVERGMLPPRRDNLTWLYWIAEEAECRPGSN
jgi:hypothetical protein